MIKTIFSERSLVEMSTQTCGFVNRHIKKELKTMKEFCSKNNLPFMCLNQFTVDFEYDCFIMHPKLFPKKYINYTNLPKVEYEVYFNSKIVRKYEPEEMVEECYSFPLLEVKMPRFRKIEVYWVDDGMDIKSKKLEGEMAQIIQLASDNLRGLSLINPLRHKGNISIKKGYELLFQHTYGFLDEFRESSNNATMDLTPEEQEAYGKFKFSTLVSPYAYYMGRSHVYAEFKARLLLDYKAIKTADEGELLRAVNDVSKERVKGYIALIKHLDLGN